MQLSELRIAMKIDSLILCFGFGLSFFELIPKYHMYFNVRT
jgi:hypothetical protein